MEVEVGGGGVSVVEVEVGVYGSKLRPCQYLSPSLLSTELSTYKVMLLPCYKVLSYNNTQPCYQQN